GDRSGTGSGVRVGSRLRRYSVNRSVIPHIVRCNDERRWVSRGTGIDLRGRSAVARLGIPHRNPTTDEDATQTVDAATARHSKIDDGPAADRAVTEERSERVLDRPAPAKTVAERPAPPAQPAPRWAHVSGFATMGLILGLLALVATFT